MFTVSVARIWSSKIRGDDQAVHWMLGSFYLFIFVIVNLFGIFETRFDEVLRQRVRLAWWWDNQWLFVTLIAANSFSLLYEIGRAWWKWVTNRDTRRETVESDNVKEQRKVQTLQDQISAIKSQIDSKEASEYYLQIAYCEAKKWMSHREAELCRRMVQFRETI